MRAIIFIAFGCILTLGIQYLVTSDKHYTESSWHEEPESYLGEFIGPEGELTYKEISAMPPSRDLFPNWLVGDSLYQRGTPEWEEVAIHPAMKIDEWAYLHRLADEH